MPKTVLLADDSVVIQKLVGLSFANEDLRLITTDNGDDALVRALQEKPDLVLADVVMPGKNGYELCQAIKEQPELAHVPVLLLTGTFEAFDDERARQSGSAGHITKPFEAQGLVDRVQELLARSPAPAASQTRQAPLPVAEPTMVVEPDNAYDFFDDDGVELATAEPIAEEPGTDLGLGDADEAFAFGSDLPPEIELQTPIGVAQAPASSAPTPGGDRTIAMTPDPQTSETRPPISEDPAATRLALDEDFAATAPGDKGQTPAPPAAMPPPPPTLNAPPPVASGPGFGSQNAAPLTSPPPLPVSEPVPTPTLEGFSFEAPPPVPGSADPGENIFADDLFVDAPQAAAPAQPEPEPETVESPANEHLEFSFEAAASAARPPVPSTPQPVAPPEPVDTAPTGDAEPAAATDPLIEPLETDPLAAPFEAESLGTSPSSDLLSAQLETEDFAADAGDDNDLLEPLSSEDASEFDVSSSDLGDPLAASGPEPPPEAEFPNEALADSAAPPAPQPALYEAEIAGTVLEPEAQRPHPAPALQEMPASATAPPDISPVMRDRIHETLEKVAWEAFADLSDSVVRHVVEKVEEIAWEVVPQMAESLIQEEIRRMKGEPEDPGE